MKNRNLYTACAAAAGMLVLILDGKTALAGAAEGIRLCLNTLIPSLFPFILLSILLTGAISGQQIPLLRRIAALCRMPEGTESLLAIGLLGGYPVGAQNVALLYRSNQLSSDQASRMIAFCNNAGPAFVFGVLGSMFSAPVIPWLLWAVHILSALCVGMALPGGTAPNTTQPLHRRFRLTEALEQAVRTMGLVCGWVVIMRMVLAFLERWFLWMLPPAAQVAVCGILELSNGCIRLSTLGNEGTRFILASAMLSLGGVCVTLQTASVTEGISMKFYFPGKLLQCSISILLACLLQPIIFPEQRESWLLPAAIGAVTGIMSIAVLRICKKSSGIPAMVGV